MKKTKRSVFQPLAEAVFGDMHKIFGLIILIGIAGSVAGIVYLNILWRIERLLGPENWSPHAQFFVLVLSGLAIGILTRALGSPGNVELLVDNIHVMGGKKDIRDLKSLIPVSLLSIAAGGAAGPEAPLVQTTGSIGSWIAYRQQLSKEDVRTLTITGMAAGLTVLFGAPLGAAIFALEILHRRGMEYYEALLPAMIGSLCGYAVFVLATGLDLAPIWNFPAMAPLRPVDLAWAVGAGVVAAPVVMAFTFANVGLRRLFQPLPEIARPAVGGAILGALAYWSPYALTFGEKQMQGLLTLPLVMGIFAVAFAAKFIGTTVTVSSGWRGGFIIPLFFLGMALGRFFHAAFPGTNEAMLMAAMMAAILTGITKTPVGSTLVVTEMAGIQLIPTTLIAVIVTMFLTSQVGLIDSQRARITDSTPNEPSEV